MGKIAGQTRPAYASVCLTLALLKSSFMSSRKGLAVLFAEMCKGYIIVTNEEGMDSSGQPAFGYRWPTVLFIALSLSIGWGIRGNFGHEWGAMIAGCLAAMAACIASGREDWWRRVAFFGTFGAIGWSFGGSMSYGQVIGYTHSGHSLSVIYGFACLFVIGFLWAAVGGAGTAMPAFLSRERLAEFAAPLSAVFITWWIRDIIKARYLEWIESRAVDPSFRQEDPLYWYDTDWTSALTAILAVLILAIIRRRLDRASQMVLYMAGGWWISFLLLPVALDLHMTPPRSDDWAGILGLTVGMWIYLQRQGLGGVTFASVVTGFIGGLGFSTAQMLKMVGISSGLETNWHSALEQSYGFINGIGIAVAMGLLRNRSPQMSDDPSVKRWMDWASPAFVLLLLTYMNLQKNPDEWVRARAQMPEMMYWMSAEGWFNLGYLALAAGILWLLITHTRHPLAIVPRSWLGKGQLLYIIFLWWMVVGNFERALVGFTEQRLITEGVIHINAVISTLMACLLVRAPIPTPVEAVAVYYRPFSRKAVITGLVVAVLAIVVNWGITRAMWGNQHVPGAGLHIRFGPHTTATTQKPEPGKPHP